MKTFELTGANKQQQRTVKPVTQIAAQSRYAGRSSAEESSVYLTLPITHKH